MTCGSVCTVVAPLNPGWCKQSSPAAEGIAWIVAPSTVSNDTRAMVFEVLAGGTQGKFLGFGISGYDPRVRPWYTRAKGGSWGWTNSYMMVRSRVAAEWGGGADGGGR